MRRRWFCPLLLILFSVSALCCRADVTLKIDDKTPPSFQFKQNLSEVGNLLVFSVIEISPENQQVSYLQQNYALNTTIWRVESVQGTISKLDGLTITYGKVPPGFVQKLPDKESPPSLVEGKIYEAGGPYIMMNLARVRFFIKDGKPVQVPIVGLR